jgi:hypothetical protein
MTFLDIEQEPSLYLSDSLMLLKWWWWWRRRRRRRRRRRMRMMMMRMRKSLPFAAGADEFMISS